MKDAKPKPRTSKLPVREPAKPLESPTPPPDHPIFNLVGPALAAQTTHHPPATDQPPPTTHPIAPARDFVRVPNSVVRDALPAGRFKGESKKTYDALYQRTRGAVVPRRTVRATLDEVMAWAGVSHNTLKAHLKHLERVGLVRRHYVRGDNTGADYEVLTPEEAPPTSHQPQTTHQPATNQNLAPPTNQNLVLGGGGQAVDFQRPSDEPKTSIKTTTTDDDELRPLRELERELKTGRGDWQPALRLVADEIRRARLNTDVVGDAAKFAAAHLTRLFAPKTRPERSQASRTLSEEQFRGQAPDPNRRLSEEELKERIAFLLDYMEHEKRTLEQIEEQFAGGFHAEDWEQVKTELSKTKGE